jgi:hypothetical protein
MVKANSTRAPVSVFETATKGASFGESTVKQLPQTVFPDASAGLGLRFALFVSQ